MQVVSSSDADEIEFVDLINHTMTTIPKIQKIAGWANSVDFIIKVDNSVRRHEFEFKFS